MSNMEKFDLSEIFMLNTQTKVESQNFNLKCAVFNVI